MSREDIRDLMLETRPQYLGPHISVAFAGDPKHLAFTLARYKFVSKMLAGYRSVLEVGCGDGFGGTLVAQAVDHLTGMDVEPHVIENVVRNDWLERKADFRVHDMLGGPLDGEFDAAYSLDVIEHIPPAEEQRFLGNIAASIRKPGVLIVGTPNVTASPYASKASQIDHINLKSHDSLKESLLQHFQQVFMFGMNDEVLHTGFSPMCHYLLGLAVGLRD
jgi:2-polyprenyl-3-methyl-5-hydroxy-6-metoxy-1,4-benzoquinol methylase